MALLTEDTVRALAGFRSDAAPVTTCYLDVDGRQLPTHREVQQAFDGSSGAAGLDGNGRTAAPSVAQDLAAHGAPRPRPRAGPCAGLAMFSCTAHGFWEVHELPVPVTSQLVVEPRPVRAPARGGARGARSASACSSPTASGPACSCSELGELVEHTERSTRWCATATDDRGELVKTRVGQPASGAGPPARAAGRPARLRRVPATPASTTSSIGAPRRRAGRARAGSCTRTCATASPTGRLPVPAARRTRCATGGARGRSERIERRDRGRARRPAPRRGGARGGRAVTGLAPHAAGASASTASTGCSCPRGYKAEGWRCRGCGRPGHASGAAARRAATTWSTSTTWSRTPSQEALAQHCPGRGAASTTPTSTCSGASAPCCATEAAPARAASTSAGTKCLGVVVDAAGAVLAGGARCPHRPGPRRCSTLLDGRRSARSARYDRFGVGAAGLVDARRRAAGGAQPAAACRDSRSRERAGGPARPRRCVVDNDATCATLAEWQRRRRRWARPTSCSSPSAPASAAASWSAAGCVRGANGFAGEPGHMVVDPNGPPCVCGRRGCWERYASGSGLARLAREAADRRPPGARSSPWPATPEAVRGEHVQSRRPARATTRRSW